MTISQRLGLTALTGAIVLSVLPLTGHTGEQFDRSHKPSHRNEFHHPGIRSTTRRNEAIVVEFYTKIFVERADVAKTSEMYLAEDYTQHNPFIGTGREAFIEAIGGWLAAVPDQRVDIKRVIADGDLVMLHSHFHVEGTGTPGSAVIDIFRVNHKGKIVEHWDVSQEIPDWMPHDNGMF